MLQRRQTLWMFLVVLSAFSLLLLVGNEIIIAKLSCFVLVLVGIISIFSYKKRRIQILLNIINMIINALLIGFLLFHLLSLSGGNNFPEKGIGFLAFPVISIVGLIVANRFIKRDEELVKSVDRFR